MLCSGQPSEVNNHQRGPVDTRAYQDRDDLLEYLHAGQRRRRAMKSNAKWQRIMRFIDTHGRTSWYSFQLLSCRQEDCEFGCMRKRGAKDCCSHQR